MPPRPFAWILVVMNVFLNSSMHTLPQGPGTNMQARRKTSRVETMGRMAGRANGNAQAHHFHHDEIMTELRALRSLLKPAEQVSLQMIDSYKAQIAEAQKLKGELDLIHDAINKTKQEIATIHLSGFEGPEMARVTNELDAIVGGTER